MGEGAPNNNNVATNGSNATATFAAANSDVQLTTQDQRRSQAEEDDKNVLLPLDVRQNPNFKIM